MINEYLMFLHCYKRMLEIVVFNNTNLNEAIQNKKV